MKVVAIENITLAVAGTPAAEVIPLLSSVLAQYDNTPSENAAPNATEGADAHSTQPTTLTSAATTPTSETPVLSRRSSTQSATKTRGKGGEVMEYWEPPYIYPIPDGVTKLTPPLHKNEANKGYKRISGGKHAKQYGCLRPGCKRMISNHDVMRCHQMKTHLGMIFECNVTPTCRIQYYNPSVMRDHLETHGFSKKTKAMDDAMINMTQLKDDGSERPYMVSELDAFNRSMDLEEQQEESSPARKARKVIASPSTGEPIPFPLPSTAPVGKTNLEYIFVHNGVFGSFIHDDEGPNMGLILFQPLTDMAVAALGVHEVDN